MRCESCGRMIKNGELWRLAAVREAPAFRSLRLLCKDCQQAAAHQADQTTVNTYLGGQLYGLAKKSA